MWPCASLCIVVKFKCLDTKKKLTVTSHKHPPFSSFLPNSSYTLNKRSCGGMRRILFQLSQQMIHKFNKQTTVCTQNEMACGQNDTQSSCLRTVFFRSGDKMMYKINFQYLQEITSSYPRKKCFCGVSGCRLFVCLFFFSSFSTYYHQ